MFSNITGVTFAFLTAISWSICIFPFTEAAKRLGANSLNHFRLLLATILLGIVSLTNSVNEFACLFSREYLEAWLWLGLSGLVGLAMGDYFAFKMYAILGARVGSVLATFSPAAALMTGYFLLDEHMNVLGICGILITVTGVIGISLGRKERKKIQDTGHGRIGQGILFGILGAACQGTGLAFAKKAFLIQEATRITLSPVNATFMRMLVSFSILGLLTVLTGKVRDVSLPVIQNREAGVKFAVGGTVFGPFLGVCLSLITITKLDVAVAQTIFSLVPAGVLLIAFLFFREKISVQSIAGILIALGGVMILIWRNNLMSLIEK